MSRLAQLETELISLADPAYKTFGDRLQPGIVNRLGVRMPQLRRLVRMILKEDPKGFLTEIFETPGSLRYQETVMMAAMLLGQTPLTVQERLLFLDRLIPSLDGWATVDLTGGELKVFREKNPQCQSFLISLLGDRRPMAVRLGLVLLLTHRKAAADLDASLALLSGSAAYELARENYLVSMAFAWLFATYYTVDPEKVESRLEADVRGGRLDRMTLARTLQKIRDSLRVAKVDKLRVTARFSEYFARSSSNLA